MRVCVCVCVCERERERERELVFNQSVLCGLLSTGIKLPLGDANTLGGCHPLI